MSGPALDEGAAELISYFAETSGEELSEQDLMDAAAEIAGEDAEDEGFFDSLLGWIIDLFASVFGAETEEVAEDGDVPAEGPPAGYEDAPSVADDIVFIEYIPLVAVDETAPADGEDLEEDTIDFF